MNTVVKSLLSASVFVAAGPSAFAGVDVFSMVHAALQAAQTNGRALPSPLDSPPFPNSDWLGTFVIGEPDSTPNGPLQHALFGKKLDSSQFRFYGYVDASYNESTSKNSNYPLTYDIVPNRPELDQGVLRFERVLNTVQTNHVDWGFRLTQLYGTDYRFTTMKGILSDQLLSRNDLYGYDPVEAYGTIYFPKWGQGTVVLYGRYISPPDIEAQLAPGNYMFTHSIMFGVDPYTFTGIFAMTRFSQYWSLLYGVHGGNDMAFWSDSSTPNGQLLVRYVSHDNNDSFWGGINSLGDGRTRNQHDNLQHIVGTWGHRFNSKVHMMTEVYNEFQYDPNKGGTVINGPGEPYYEGTGAGPVLPGKADATGAVNYLQYELSPKDYLSLRTDYFNDPRGWRYGYNTAYTSHTLAYVRWLSPTTEFRPEVRYDHSYASGVTPFDNGTRKDQWTLAADIIFKF
jgi:hypothetical protein